MNKRLATTSIRSINVRENQSISSVFKQKCGTKLTVRKVIPMFAISIFKKSFASSFPLKLFCRSDAFL
jgi:hypothetical protein